MDIAISPPESSLSGGEIALLLLFAKEEARKLKDYIFVFCFFCEKETLSHFRRETR
jgi:hypothetical protein